MKKGARTLVAGKLVQRSFEVEGAKRTAVEIVATEVAADLAFATVEIKKAEKQEEPA